MNINFENIEKKCSEATATEEYTKLVNKLKKSKKIFLIGNGGLDFLVLVIHQTLSKLYIGPKNKTLKHS